MRIRHTRAGGHDDLFGASLIFSNLVFIILMIMRDDPCYGQHV